MRYSNEQREAYENVNRIFAQKLLPLLQPRDLVCGMHDYHLIPLGLRGCASWGAAPGRLLPAHSISKHRNASGAAVLRGAAARDLTSYDVVGFQ